MNKDSILPDSALFNLIALENGA